MRDWCLIVFNSLMPNKLKTQTSVASGNLSCMVAVGLFSFGFPAADSLLETWGVISLITLRNLLGLLFLVGLMAFKMSVSSLAQLPWIKGFWIGFFGFGIGSMLLLLSQSMTNAVTAALAAATMPICAVALEVAFDGKRLTLNFFGWRSPCRTRRFDCLWHPIRRFSNWVGFFDRLVCLLTFCLGFASNGQGISRIDTTCKDHRYNPWHDRILRFCVLWCPHFQNTRRNNSNANKQ